MEGLKADKNLKAQAILFRLFSLSMVVAVSQISEYGWIRFLEMMQFSSSEVRMVQIIRFGCVSSSGLVSQSSENQKKSLKSLKSPTIWKDLNSLGTLTKHNNGNSLKK